MTKYSPLTKKETLCNFSICTYIEVLPPANSKINKKL